MDESHFSPLGLIKIVRAERSRGRGRRSRGKKQRARARETARLYEGMVERRGRKNRAEAREREREIWALLSRGRGTLSVTFPRTICPPTFPTVRSSIANILHRHRRFDWPTLSFPAFSWDSRAIKPRFPLGEINFRGGRGAPLPENSDSTGISIESAERAQWIDDQKYRSESNWGGIDRKSQSPLQSFSNARY